MRNDVESRLHRVMIKLDKKALRCPNSEYCDSAENCNRCNQFFHKCSKFTDFNSGSL